MLGAKWPGGDKAFFGAGRREGLVPKILQERTMLWHSLSLPDPSEGTGTGWLCSSKGGRHFPRKGESLSQKILLLKIKLFIFI